jgi:hypothetical protein
VRAASQMKTSRIVLSSCRSAPVSLAAVEF